MLNCEASGSASASGRKPLGISPRLRASVCFSHRRRNMPPVWKNVSRSSARPSDGGFSNVSTLAIHCGVQPSAAASLLRDSPAISRRARSSLTKTSWKGEQSAPRGGVTGGASRVSVGRFRVSAPSGRVLRGGCSVRSSR